MVKVLTQVKQNGIEYVEYVYQKPNYFHVFASIAVVICLVALVATLFVVLK